MKAPVIRDFEPDDIDDLVDIAIAAWEPVFVSFKELIGDAINAIVYPDWQQDKERQIREAAASTSSVQFIVAELHSTIVGFASYVTRRDGIGEIGNNAVHPDFQNRGIASSLYNETLRRMKAQGMRCAEVTTGLDESHAPARRAYQKAGFNRAIPMTTYYREL